MVIGFNGQLAPYQTRIKVLEHIKIGFKPKLEGFNGRSNQIFNHQCKEIWTKFVTLIHWAIHKEARETISRVRDQLER